MRKQDCREKFEWICEHCGIGVDAKRELERALEFCEVHPTLVDLSTKAIMPLIREPDPEVRDNAILSVSKSLDSGKNPINGQFAKKVTEKDVRQVIEKEREKKSVAPVSTFNSTNDNIEWAKWSWNPVTGCKHGCDYCYARDIARRFYDTGFEPTFHENRLSAPKNTKVPEEAKTNVGYKNVFVCSMADLFGDWVPKEWIEKVIQAVRENPQWNFLFLTKNPKRYLEFTFPENSWLGTTVDKQERVESAQDAFRKISDRKNIMFLSCEPLLDPLSFTELSLWHWIIIGGSSGNSQTPAIQPEWDWVESLLTQARDNRLDVYFKPNLTIRPLEYPEGY